MFQEGLVDKCYQAIVYGDFSALPARYEVDRMVDGKAAKSVFSYVDHNENYSLVDVQLLTGRKHQIRQHLSEMGFPIVGDRLYGTAKNETMDLQLQSVSLEFACPLTHQLKHFAVADHQRMKL